MVALMTLCALDVPMDLATISLTPKTSQTALTGPPPGINQFPSETSKKKIKRLKKKLDKMDPKRIERRRRIKKSPKLKRSKRLEKKRAKQIEEMKNSDWYKDTFKNELALYNK